MFKALGAMWHALFILFGATEKLARALDHTCEYIEGEAQHFNNEGKLERAQKLKLLKAAA